MKTKVCTNCLETKSIKDFYKNSKMKDGFLHQCKKCVLAAQKEKYEENKEVYLERFKEYRQKNPTYQQEYDLIRKYGMTLKDYDEMLEEQNGCCKICETTEPGRYGRFHVDHNHETGEVRGLLCANCNTGLGLLKDSPSILKQALEYLETNGHYGK